MKEIGKDFVENIVIAYLEKNIFSREAIDRLIGKITEYTAEQFQEINRDIKTFTNQLAGVQIEINNIVNAIAAGMYHPSMKEKMDELETRKASLSIKLEEAKLQAETHAPTPEMIRKYLEKDADIRNKSPEEQKKIIQAYIQRVVVYDDKIDIHSIDLSRYNIIEGNCGFRPIRSASTKFINLHALQIVISQLPWQLTYFLFIR